MNIFFYIAHVTESRRTLLNFILSLNYVNFEQLQSQGKIKMLLYGDTFLSYATNKLILKETQKYLETIKCFL